ncbi:MAG: NupC/NupG family nucleoside CNT transporter [Luteibaculaceae bacterium]
MQNLQRLFFIGISWLLVSCTSVDKKNELIPLENFIAKEWVLYQTTELTDTLGSLQLNVSATDSTFLLNLRDSEAMNGAWTLNDMVLRLFVFDSKREGLIDSITFSNEQISPKITFYQGDGALLSFSKNKGFELKKDSIINYQIVQLDNNTLQLTSCGTAVIAHQQSKIFESNFSVSTVMRGFLGILTLLFIAFIFSENRKAISWSLVAKGLAIQIIFAIGVLKVPIVEKGFSAVSSVFVKIISFTQQGVNFLFSSFVTNTIEPGLVNFAVQVLPTIIFFSALTSLLYYLGILQRFVYGFAWIMKRIMKLSGAESLAAAGNIFLGQTEAPLLVRPYLINMTRSEMACLMTGGMATIAGGVLAAYVGFLGGSDPVQQLFFAKHLLAASVMAAPAAVVSAKILVPETEKFNQELKISSDKIGSNALEAIANGTTDGLKLAVNVAAMILVFIALIAMFNYVMGDVLGSFWGINDWIRANTNYDMLSLQMIIGYIFAPIAWMIGVHANDIVLVGQLLGEKIILNEFIGYVSLGDMKNSGIFHEEKSILMSTYILCGFANFASIGIQIGGIGSLVPSRKGLLSKLGFKALLGGTLTCLFTATIVGMLY